jgi:hypothetical protein
MYCKSIAKRFGPFIIRSHGDGLPAIFHVAGVRCAPYNKDYDDFGIRKNIDPKDIAKGLNKFLVRLANNGWSDGYIATRYLL